jgi:hypothetical protein
MHSRRVSRRTSFALVLLALCSAAAGAVPPDGTYLGTTSQGRSISITVSGGAVTHLSIGWACGSSSGTSDVSVNCPIGGGDSFQCGSSSCSFTPFTARFSTGGTFTGASVAGSFDFSFYPCISGCSCCFGSNVTYSASLPTPELSIQDVTVTEGDSGTTPAQFQVTLTPAASETVTVDWTTADGTADSSDYVPDSGSLTFTAGQTSKIVTVQVLGDVEEEADEVFYVDLENPTNADISDGRGQCTIADDDTILPDPVTMSLNVHGFASIDLLDDADNDIFIKELGEGALLTGVGWDVNITTHGGSWLSEAAMYFDGSDQDGSGLFLTPGVGDDLPGTASYSSEVVDLTDNGIPDIPILGDGRLYVQFFETFDDTADSADAIYESPSTLTIQYLPSPNHIFTDGFESGDTSAWGN